MEHNLQDAEEPITGASDILQQRLQATEQWLKHQAPATLSIQLLSASSENKLREQLKMLAAQFALDEIYVFRTRVNDQPYLSLLYGSYLSREEAVATMRKLPPELMSYSPQLRTVGGISQETKQLQ